MNDLGLKKSSIKVSSWATFSSINGQRQIQSFPSRQEGEGAGTELCSPRTGLMVMIMSCSYTVPFIQITLRAEFMLATA